MRLSLSISPCPNDTFMFDALINGRIDSRGLEFDVHYADIEELNRRVVGGVSDVSKVSCAVLPEIAYAYRILDSGSALGRGNGPLLVGRAGVKDSGSGGLKVAVPGFRTTANLLISRLFPHITDKNEVLFSQIAESVASGRYDAGVLIHEGRFTYRKHGLELLADLGAEWERVTGLPLPLGSIVVSRRLPEEVQAAVGELLRESIRYALANPAASADFVKSHAQEMDDDVIRSHIGMFVNDFSISLGADGRRAIKKLTGLDASVFIP